MSNRARFRAVPVALIIYPSPFSDYTLKNLTNNVMCSLPSFFKAERNVLVLTLTRIFWFTYCSY